MTYDNTLFTFANATDLILDIPPTALSSAWQLSQSGSTPASRYQTYLNQLCLDAVLPWLQEEFTPQAKPVPSVAALPSFWEFVNGSAIALADGTRLILVPTEAMDDSELRVPQEWVDIPSWVGDYYLGVQVEPDDGYVRVWGYCTHEKLKTSGSFDVGDRTYALAASEMICDLSVLVIARQLCLQENTRNGSIQLPTLSQTHAQNLISRLANPEITPRLAIPFHMWGGLIEHGGWRKSLYQRRLGQPEQWSIWQWLHSGVSELAQQLSWGSLEMQASFAGARSVQQNQLQAVLAKQLVIAGQNYELRVIPQGDEEERIWRFELQNANPGGVIPGGFKLRLLTEDLQPFENNEDVATSAVEQLFVEVALEPGECIVWETEPLPENYDREILRF